MMDDQERKYLERQQMELKEILEELKKKPRQKNREVRQVKAKRRVVKPCRQKRIAEQKAFTRVAQRNLYNRTR